MRDEGSNGGDWESFVRNFGIGETLDLSSGSYEVNESKVLFEPEEGATMVYTYATIQTLQELLHRKK